MLTDPGVTHVIVGDKPEGLQGFQAPKHVKVVEARHLPSNTMHTPTSPAPEGQNLADLIKLCYARVNQDANSRVDAACMWGNMESVRLIDAALRR